MKAVREEAPAVKRSLSIEQWRRLGQQGNMIPVTITLDGESMRPLIRRGKDAVTIFPLYRDIMIGDIVLFCGGQGLYVVHRVWKLRDGCVQTLGDNCMNPDPWMPIERVCGLVVRVDRFGRSWRSDTSFFRAWGRLWMAIFPLRVLYKRSRNLAARCFRRT